MNALSTHRPRLREMTSLTDKQSEFVVELVASGCTPTEAARRTGFSAPGQEAYRLMRKPHVLAAVRDERERLIAGTGCNVAIKTLMEIMTDTAIPGSARVSACRVMLDAGGMFAKNNPWGGEDKPAAEMSQAELERFIEKLEAAQSAGADMPVISVIDA